MTDDRGATALTERLQTIPVPSSYEEWLARLGASYEDDALAILGEHGVFLPDGRDDAYLRGIGDASLNLMARLCVCGTLPGMHEPSLDIELERLREMLGRLVSLGWIMDSLPEDLALDLYHYDRPVLSPEPKPETRKS